MATAPATSPHEQLAALPPHEREAYLDDASEPELEALWHDWTFWARPEQLPPADDTWDIFLLLGGRGSGKTRPGAELIHQWALNPDWHFALVGETAAEVRDVMVEGESGLLATQKPWNPCGYEPSKRRVVWPQTGAWATTYSGDSPDQLRGPNCHGAWVDELAKFRHPILTWDNLEMVLRAGEHPRAVVSTTPRPIPLLLDLMQAPGTVLRRYSTYANLSNLAPSFIRRILGRYEGTRLGRQELHAEILADVVGALWSRPGLDHTRVHRAPPLARIVVGVDPHASTGETGIVVAGLGQDGHGYVLDDRTTGGSPATWASQVVAAYHAHRADRAVAEVNNGGDMVIFTIEAVDPTVATTKVHASRGKQARAEPVAALYEQGRVHHVGLLAALEDELCTWVPGETAASPNRLDALVWAVTALMIERPTPHRVGVWGR